MNAIDRFRAALIANDIVPPDTIVADGRLHRCDASGKHGRGDAAYLLHLDGIPAGGFQNWRNGLGWINWRMDLGRPLTPTEVAALSIQVEKSRLSRDDAFREEAIKARKLAQFIMKRAKPASDSHPYLVAKNVRANGLLQYKDLLVMPISNELNEIQTLQLIRPDGSKLFLKHLPKKGGYYVIGSLGKMIYIAEGFATGATIHEATNDGVVVAIDASNLEAVARKIRSLYANSEVVICADDDFNTPGNPGISAAQAAAGAVNGRLAVPRFGAPRCPDQVDFNDLSRIGGHEVVRRNLTAMNSGSGAAPTEQVDVLNGNDKDGQLIVLCGSDVKIEPVDWIWPGYLARRKLHILASVAGMGKTTLAISIAAILANGGAFPDGSMAKPMGVLIASFEDDICDTLAPRAIAAGADMANVHFLRGVREGNAQRTFDCSTDLPLLRAAAAAIGNLGVVIVDPIVGALGDYDSHKNAETRKALHPLTAFGEETGIAILGITHFSKNTGSREPLERVVGSLAFGAVARVVLVAGRTEDASGDERRIFCRAKSNIGPDGGGFSYSLSQKEIRPGLSASVVHWIEPVFGQARQLLGSEPAVTPGRLDDAVDFLATLLQSGPRQKREIDELAKMSGIASATLRRAQSALGVEAFKQGMRDGWCWRLPASKQPVPSSV